MNTDIFAAPRILIVENEPGTVAALESDLRKVLPSSIIKSVGTVVEGQEQLNDAYDHQTPFDIALLDFKLPHDRSSGDEVADLQLGQLRDEATLIVQMTAYPEDPDFQRIKLPPESAAAANRLFIAKDVEKDWTIEIAKACVRHVHSARIRQEFERLFGEEASPPRLGRHEGRPGSGRSNLARSSEIAVLCDIAGAHWDDLDAPLRKKLADTLGHVYDKQGHHYVGVVPEFPLRRKTGKRGAR
jgi:CheY-like chemotaxis protein